MLVLCRFYNAIPLLVRNEKLFFVIIPFVARNLFELIYQSSNVEMDLEKSKITFTHLDLLPTAHILIQRLTGFCYGLSYI